MKLAQQIPAEALVQLRQRLDLLRPRSAERRRLVTATAELYGVSPDSLYRALRQLNRPHSAHRSDKGRPRKLPLSELENYCEIIAALKVRTTNKKGRHLSTGRAIEILEQHGVQTPNGLVKVTAGLLKITTVNRYLKAWGYDYTSLLSEPPAVRFQADFSNDCWQFDLSPSDLKHLAKPAWSNELRGRDNPLLMLYSIVDDRSGACYQEYHLVYGEDVEAALKFLFNAMSAKTVANFPLRGIPKMIYTDNGPVARSRVFRNVMKYLGVEVHTHQPKGADGRRTTARSKGKVERAFRTVKEAHETLYHFHQPESEREANEWLHNYLVRYNDQQHRGESDSRFEDWLKNSPPEGIRDMCSWERFCTFAREPEQRKVGNDARVSIDGIGYEVDPELAGETVILWWGLFDDELFVELNDHRFGPFSPIGQATGTAHFRRFKKTRRDARADRVAALAEKLELPRSVLTGTSDLDFLPVEPEFAQPATIPFQDPDPFHEFAYPNALFAKRAISDFLGLPLMKLSAVQRAFIDSLLTETLNKKNIFEQIKNYFHTSRLSESLIPEIAEEEDKYVN